MSITERVLCVFPRASLVPEEGGASGTKSYLLQSLLPRGLRAGLVLDAGGSKARGFALVVLTLIHKSGGKLEESSLWSWLGQLGVRK